MQSVDVFMSSDVEHFGLLKNKIIGIFLVTISFLRAEIKDLRYWREKLEKLPSSKIFAQESKICITSAPDLTCSLTYKKQASVNLANNIWEASLCFLIKLIVLLKFFDVLPSIEYAAKVQGLPVNPISGILLGKEFLIFETASYT